VVGALICVRDRAALRLSASRSITPENQKKLRATVTQTVTHHFVTTEIINNIRQSQFNCDGLQIRVRQFDSGRGLQKNPTNPPVLININHANCAQPRTNRGYNRDSDCDSRISNSLFVQDLHKDQSSTILALVVRLFYVTKVSKVWIIHSPNLIEY